jgi:tRNA threonylcarbamoyladenosine biosynthesis protein TsaB
MNFLAFDTSTEHLHLGVACGAATLTQVHPGAAQASQLIIPQALQLLADIGLKLQDLDAIVMGRGPGSFTGLRTACAVAQGLAYGAQLKVLPIDTLWAVAEDARHRHGARRVLSILDARMGQYYASAWSFEGELGVPVMSPALLNPEELVLPKAWRQDPQPVCAAGIGLDAVAEALRQQHDLLQVQTAHPTAEALLRLAPPAWQQNLAVSPEQATPLYLRDKVAQTTAERERLKQS